MSLRPVLPAIFWAAAASACRTPPDPTPAPARVSVIERAEQLVWGAGASAALGDLRLENGQIVAIISSLDRGYGFAFSGGNLIDLAPLPEAEDELNQVFLYLSDQFPRQARYRTLEIVDPGGAKSPARVLARGVDSSNPGNAIETEYRLDPGANWLTMTTRVTSSSSVAQRGFSIGDAIQWGHAEHLGPGQGFDLDGKRIDLPWIAGIGERTSYAFVPDGPATFRGAHGSVWSDPIGPTVDLERGKPASYVRHFVVGRGDTASLQPAIARLRREAIGRISGRVLHGGAPAADAVVHVLDDQLGLVGLAKVDPDGAWSIVVPPGGYVLEAHAPGRRAVRHPGAPVRVDAGGSEALSFELGPSGAIEWRIEGDDGRAPPLKATFLGVGETPEPGFGPLFRAAGARNIILSPRGVGSAALGSGRYRVLLSRGPEYELIDREVTLEEGQRAVIEGKLVRSVDSRGLIAADLHQHAVPSFDSAVPLPDRVLTNAAEGVEVLVSTDHNVITDYQPVIAGTGLGRAVATILGTEATTHSVGHFNAFPLNIRRDDPRGGMVDPEGWTPQQIFAHLRGLATPDIPVFIQANHPRAGPIGYFDLMKLDANGVAADPRFREDIDGLEVIFFGFPEITEPEIADWFALLKRGLRITATGNSDSHVVYGREVGWPRTLVCLDDDRPTHLDIAAFTEALHRGCATISGGPLVRIRAGAVPMGGLAEATRGRISVQVEVQAPSWVATDRLRIYVDGGVRLEIPLTSEHVVRFSKTLEITCSADCFIVARVDGDHELPAVVSNSSRRRPLPIALTNPIYVDADGDGRYKQQERR